MLIDYPVKLDNEAVPEPEERCCDGYDHRINPAMMLVRMNTARFQIRK